MALKLTLFCFMTMTALEIGLTDANRTDYTYIESTHSFYKHHQKMINWTQARSVCQSEGAILFHPENESEYFQVLSVLGVGKKNNLWAGIYYSSESGVYETIDGRPLSHVYNDWYSGYSASGGSNESCAVLDVQNSRKLFLDKCKFVAAYICKLLPTLENIMLKTAIEQVNTVIVSATDKLAEALERQAKNETTALGQFAEIMQQQIKIMQHQTEITQQQSAKQTAALERLAQSVLQQAVVMQHQEAMQLQAANLTAVHEQLEKNHSRALERQALAQEKLAAGFLTYTAAIHMLTSAKNEENDDLGEQSQQ